MHMPFCTVADKCMQCDNVRAKREIERLRRVLRTTMDDLIAEREEVKELNNKVVKLQTAIALAQKGKLSVSKIKVPESLNLGAEVRRLGLTGEGEGNY